MPQGKSNSKDLCNQFPFTAKALFETSTRCSHTASQTSDYQTAGAPDGSVV